MHDLVVVGSGPGGSSAAIAAARRGSRVLIIERGGEVGGPPGKRTLGQLLNAVKHIDNLAPRVAGGGSAINYGVVATPTANDIANAVGGSHTVRQPTPPCRIYEARGGSTSPLQALRR